jgi:F-type H+-transporting ATPase subunit b
MHFDWATFAFQVVNILVLMWLLGRYFFRPVAKIIAARQAEVDRVLMAAEASQAQATKAEAAAQVERNRLAADRIKVIAAAQEEAEAQRAAILAKAASEAADATRSAQFAATRRALDEQREQMRQAADLAVVITQRLLDELPASARVTGYPERLRRSLAELSEDKRAELTGADSSLRFVAPRTLTESEMAQAMDAVQSVARQGTLPVDVDASLLAGLELRSNQGVIHNSLRYDLDRIAEALANHEET